MYTVQCTQTILLRIQHKVVVVVVLASVEEIKLWITSLLGPSHGLKVGTVSGDKRGQFVDDVTQSVIWTRWGLAMEVGVGDLEYGSEDWRSRNGVRIGDLEYGVRLGDLEYGGGD